MTSLAMPQPLKPTLLENTKVMNKKYKTLDIRAELLKWDKDIKFLEDRLKYHKGKRQRLLQEIEKNQQELIELPAQIEKQEAQLAEFKAVRQKLPDNLATLKYGSCVVIEL